MTPFFLRAFWSFVLVAGSGAGCGSKHKEPESPSNASAKVDPSSTDAPVEQSYADAMRLVCDAPDQCCTHSEPGSTSADLATWITARLTNAEVKMFFAELGGVNPSERPGLLEGALAKAGIAPASCAFYGVTARAR
ncbi:MAG: hypothetical protein SFX73_15000 [Kofleriaceae bacterium]|nr:hypothetical protein [Kofleriaceae bacterium]